MNTAPHRLAVLIPAYQAARSVGAVVRRSRAFAEVWVVDDGSTDGTGAAAAAAGAQLLVHRTNLGKGAALRTGLAALFAGGCDVVATLDADGQHLPEELPRLFECLPQEPDLVLGVRDHLFARMAPLRRLANGLSSRGISLLAGRRFSDVQTGFRLYGRDLFETLGWPENGFEAESAVVVRAARAGCRIATTPVAMAEIDGRATSHYRPLRDSLRIARAVVRARLETPRSGEPALRGARVAPPLGSPRSEAAR
jgi:glycosyltransferase involved in cell wall biosynthesis